jgi:hypothetical protein
LNILGIFNKIFTPGFPAAHKSMYLVIKLAADLGEYDTDHDVRILFLDTDGNELGAMEVSARFGRPPNGAVAEAQLILQVVDLALPKEGRYDFRLLINKDLKGVLPLDALAIPKPKQEDAPMG